jgi:hypothetical protein
MDENDLQNRRAQSTQPGHEFETPIVRELPWEMRHSERGRRQTKSTLSDATLAETSPEDRRSAVRDVPPFAASSALGANVRMRTWVRTGFSWRGYARAVLSAFVLLDACDTGENQ